MNTRPIADPPNVAPPASGAVSCAAAAGKYLTFALGAEEYGLGILTVREIIGYMDVTAVPRTPPHVRGVINLRGQVIPVVDLRARFSMPPAARTDQTCIVVAEVGGGAGGRAVNTGVIVDRVCEVLTIPADRIEDAPSFGAAAADAAFVRGVAKVGDRVKILLDIDRVLAKDDVEWSPARVDAPAAEATAVAA
ncbi:MAG: chemotaxis protein [Phycisphaerales bacterium]|nr:chemotaxis protein [Phycisphaerales bacterium]